MSPNQWDGLGVLSLSKKHGKPFFEKLLLKTIERVFPSFMDSNQCRGARGLLNWTQADMAASGVSVVTIHNFEIGKSDPRRSTLRIMVQTLETAGIVFLADGEWWQAGPACDYVKPDDTLSGDLRLS